jgi:hypothetical protein
MNTSPGRVSKMMPGSTLLSQHPITITWRRLAFRERFPALPLDLVVACAEAAVAVDQ